MEVVEVGPSDAAGVSRGRRPGTGDETETERRPPPGIILGREGKGREGKGRGGGPMMAAGRGWSYRGKCGCVAVGGWGEV